MCTAVASQANEEMNKADMKKVGLVDAHAYSLIGATILELDNGGQERLLKVRNPWGKREWTGDWSDKSPLWTAKTKAQVNLVDADDGTFWISFRDYCTFFYITTICFYKDNFDDNTLPDMHDIDSWGMAKFELKEDYRKPITFAIDQVNYRFVDETMLGSYEYPAIKFFLTQITTRNINGQEYKEQAYVHGEREANTTCMSPFEEGLPAGQYIVMYQGEFHEEHPERKLVASIYA